MLGISPLMIILNENENANQIAGYAFYLIIVGVVCKIIQYLKNSSLNGVNQVDEMERQPWILMNPLQIQKLMKILM